MYHSHEASMDMVKVMLCTFTSVFATIRHLVETLEVVVLQMPRQHPGVVLGMSSCPNTSPSRRFSLVPGAACPDQRLVNVVTFLLSYVTLLWTVYGV